MFSIYLIHLSNSYSSQGTSILARSPSSSSERLLESSSESEFSFFFFVGDLDLAFFIFFCFSMNSAFNSSSVSVSIYYFLSTFLLATSFRFRKSCSRFLLSSSSFLTPSASYPPRYSQPMIESLTNVFLNVS